MLRLISLSHIQNVFNITLSPAQLLSLIKRKTILTTNITMQGREMPNYTGTQILI